MLTEKEYQDRLDKIQALRERVADQLSGSLVSNPALAEQLNDQLDALEQEAADRDGGQPGPADGGFASLVGLGPQAAKNFGETLTSQGVAPYDDQVNSERIVAVRDLYYIYQHEQIGVFKVVQKLKQLFEAGAVRLSAGPGAYRLYQFDRRDVLRYTKKDRLDAYRRVLGYGRGLGAGQSRPNTDFHLLFSHFVNQVTLFWRDKRISDVIRERALDPSFGSIAVVRRSGLDLRNNLKFTSFGHLNVMRVELMQVLDECFKILGAPDVLDLFGADNAWDVVDEVLIRYFDERLQSSPRQRMAVTGRDILRWLSRSAHPRNRPRPVRGAAYEHRRARRGVADVGPGDEPGTADRLRPGASLGAAGSVRHRSAVRRAEPGHYGGRAVLTGLPAKLSAAPSRTATGLPAAGWARDLPRQPFWTTALALLVRRGPVRRGRSRCRQARVAARACEPSPNGSRSRR